MEVFSKSDIGLVRNQNQDDCRFGVISPSCVWAVVCDGMGGANGGNIASATAVDYISTKITDLYKDDMTKEQIGELMAEIVVNANMKVFEMSMKDPELTGMGTTCEFVFVKDTTVHVVHVGDSRTYAIRGGKIKQLTEDHSVVQEMVRRGEITYEQAQNHPNKNFITRALGIKHPFALTILKPTLFTVMFFSSVPTDFQIALQQEIWSKSAMKTVAKVLSQSLLTRRKTAEVLIISQLP